MTPKMSPNSPKWKSSGLPLSQKTNTHFRSAHQGALLGEAERCLHPHDDDEGEEAEHVDQAARHAGDVGLVEEGADQEAHGHDAQAVVAEEEEEQEAVAAGQYAAVLEHQCEDDDGEEQVHGAVHEPGAEVAERVDAHHLHVLREGNKTRVMESC